MSERPLPTQPSLRRLREYGLRPKRDLGQNFLVDSNILGVIERIADLEPSDVVLEIGGGLGVLSEHLAARAAHVHVVEIDRGLIPALADALAPFSTTTLHVGDAMALDLGALDPAPTKVIANLPYGIAASVTLRTIEELPSVSRWLAERDRDVTVDRHIARAVEGRCALRHRRQVAADGRAVDRDIIEANGTARAVGCACCAIHAAGCKGADNAEHGVRIILNGEVRAQVDSARHPRRRGRLRERLHVGEARAAIGRDLHHECVGGGVAVIVLEAEGDAAEADGPSKRLLSYSF